MNRWFTSSVKGTIALVQPPVSRWRLYKWYAPLASQQAPLGLLYLATHLKRNNFQVELLDGEKLGRKQLLSKLRSMKPEIIGLTATTFSFHDASALIAMIRKEHPNALLLMGGPHVSALPEDSLRRVPELDGSVVGEGENTFLDIAKGIPPATISGLVWRENLTSIRLNKKRHQEPDLDQFKLDWTLLAGFPKLYRPAWQSSNTGQAVSLIMSRGCSYNCSFCAGAVIHGKVRRAHTPEYVVKTMNRLSGRYGISGIYFHDDYFTQDETWLSEFCDRLGSGRNDLRWACSSRIEVLNDRVLAMMKKAGCYQIGIGVESAAKDVLEWMDKGTAIEAVVETIGSIHQAGISVKAYVMVATPLDSISDLAKTWRLLAKSRVDHVQVVYFTPLPGSRDSQRYPTTASQWRRMNLLNQIIKPTLPIALLRTYELGLYATVYTAGWLRQLQQDGHNG